MGTKDKRIDIYIARSEPFAKPILVHLRKLIHMAVPEVEETMKWSFPHFDYHGMMCSMAAFKQHCTFGFWKAALMSDPDKILGSASESAMGHFGRIATLNDLPSDRILIKYIKEAASLNKNGIKLPPRPRTQKKGINPPAYLTEALRKNKKAQQTFDAFTPSHKREYIEWIVEAKTEPTRQKRLITTIGWLSEGKPLNWRYMKRY